MSLASAGIATSLVSFDDYGHGGQIECMAVVCLDGLTLGALAGELQIGRML